MKTLIIALVSIPLLNLASTNKQIAVTPNKKTVEAAKSTGKFILVMSHADDNAKAAILENRHTSKFLNDHFVIEQQGNTNGQNLYLIYNQRQELVHRVTNEPYPYELAVKIKRALDPETQYYTLLARFENGDHSAAILENLVKAASDAGDRKNASRLMQAYLETQESPLAPENIQLLAKHTTESSDPGFALLLADIAAADDVLGNGKTAEKLASIVFNEVFVPQLDKKNVDLDAMAEKAKSMLPNNDLAYLIDGMVIQFLEMREDWDALQSALPAYLNAHGNQLSEAMHKYYSWLGTEHLAGGKNAAHNR